MTHQILETPRHRATFRHWLSSAASLALLANLLPLEAWAAIPRQDDVSIPGPVNASDAPIRTAPPVLSGADSDLTQAAQVQAAAPPGFEDLDGPIETLFDVFYQSRRIGAFNGRLENGQIVLIDAAGLSTQIPGADPALVADLLARPLASNENLRCLPNETLACGVLPSGVSGVIVNPDTFRVDLFLGREYLSAGEPSGRRLGMPISGPSLIQNFSGTISADESGGSRLRYGFGLDTLGSIGRTSAVSRIFANEDRGMQLEEGYLQQYRDNVRLAGGVLQTQNSLTLTNLRFFGAEVSSFNGGQLDQDQFAATPIDVVLPRASRVEIYRNGALVSAAQYSGGLQLIDTSRLPGGSYPIRIVVRDASGVTLDEVRTFTRAADLPPPGRTIFSLRAGVRAADNFNSLLAVDERRPFLPDSTGEAIFSASASRRVGRAAGVTLGFTSVDGEFYPEAALQIYRGQIRAAAGAALGPEGQYSAILGTSFQFRAITGSVSLRSVKAIPLDLTTLTRSQRYRPFLQSENSVYASLQAPFAGGSLGGRIGVSDTELSGDRYTYAVNYSRPVIATRLGTGFMTVDAVASDIENRVGIRFTFLRGMGPRASATTSLGGEYISSRTPSGDERDGLYPVAVAGYSRSAQFREAELTGSASAGISNGDVGLQLSGTAASRVGDADVYVGVSRSRLTDETDTFFTSNVRTGFLYGGGVLQLGSHGIGDAAVLVDLEDTVDQGDSDGRFRVVIDDLPYQTIRVNQRAAIALPAFTRPRIGLVPEAAPPFDIDLTPREVPLYPGNVVRLEWSATRVVTVYGRLVDSAGFPVPGARIESGADVTVTSEDGYFSITGPGGAPLTATLAGRTSCGTIATIALPENRSKRGVVALGTLTCSVPPL